MTKMLEAVLETLYASLRIQQLHKKTSIEGNFEETKNLRNSGPHERMNKLPKKRDG